MLSGGNRIALPPKGGAAAPHICIQVEITGLLLSDERIRPRDRLNPRLRSETWGTPGNFSDLGHPPPNRTVQHKSIRTASDHCVNVCIESQWLPNRSQMMAIAKIQAIPRDINATVFLFMRQSKAHNR